MTTISLPANDLVYDATRGRIYASVPTSASQYSNAIAIIDPATGVIVGTIPFRPGTEPNKLAISDDGQFLYVGLDGIGSIQRIDLRESVVSFEVRWALGSDSNGWARYAGSLAVQPGHPRVLAVGLAYKGMSPPGAGVAIYDDTVRRPAVLPTYPDRPEGVAFNATGDVLYGADGQTLVTMTVDSSGVHKTATKWDGIGGPPVRYDNGIVYGAGSTAFDTRANHVAGTFPAALSALPASDLGLAITVARTTGSAFVVQACSLEKWRTIWSVMIPDSANFNVVGLIRAGNRRIAFRAGSYSVSTARIVIVDFSAAAPSRLLTVNRAGAGGGTVVSPDRTINCGDACSAGFPEGTSVALTATPSAGSSFAGWSGDPDCADGVVAMTAARTCTAMFAATMPSGPPILRLGLHASGLAWDAHAGLLWASVPGDVPEMGDSVVSIDPRTGQVGSVIEVGSEPTKIAISDDGHYLYVGLGSAGAIRRVDLEARTADLRFFVGSDTYGPPGIGDIEVLPGAPHSVAVTTTGAPYLLAIFDDGVVRANTVPYTDERLAFGSDASRLYATKGSSLLRLQLSASGAALESSANLPDSSYEILGFMSGLLYGTNGRIIDPETGALVGNIAVPLYGLTALGPGTRAAFAVPHSSPLVISRYSLDTLGLASSVTTDVSALGPWASGLVAWGSAGAAFWQTSGIVIANFDDQPVLQNLTVNIAGTGQGSVSSSIGGINCGATCQASLPNGATVTLTAAASVGSTFTGWSGDADCADGVVTMSAPKNCMATFRVANEPPLTITRVPLRTNDLAFAASSGRLYASIPDDVPNVGNSVAVIDPTTASILTSIPVGQRPNKLALSDDARYLYVGLDGINGVTRVDLQTMTIDTPFALDVSAPATDIAVQPGNNDIVAVARNGGVAIFDHGVRRGAASQSSATISSIEFAGTGSSLFGYSGTSSGYLTRLLVDGSGVTALGTYHGAATGGNIRYAGGLLYSGGGGIIDPAAGLLRGAFLFGDGVSASGPIVAPDPAHNQAFLLGCFNGCFDAWTLAAYDATTFLRRWSFTINAQSVTSPIMVQTGPDAVAFRADASLVFVQVATPPVAYTLRVHKAGNGTGRIRTADKVLNCGGTCRSDYAPGTVITLSATADAGSTFAGWSGDEDCADAVVTMAAARTCVATFATVAVMPSVRRLALRARDLAYDAQRGRLYASISSTEPDGLGNSIVAIDPATGSMDRLVWAGADPHKLAMSRDNASLYVGLDGAGGFARLELATNTLGAPVSFGYDGNSEAVMAGDLQVQPGHDVVVVAAQRRTDSYGSSVVAYAGTEKLASTLSYADNGGQLTFGGTPDMLYTPATSGFKRVSLASDGLHLLSSVSGLRQGTLRYDDGRLYSSAGQVTDPESGWVLGSFPLSGSYAAFSLNSARGIATFLGYESHSSQATLSAYDETTYTRRWSMAVPFGGSVSSNGVAGTVTWGSDGIAFLTDEAVFIVDYSAMVGMGTLSLTKSGYGTVAGPGFGCSESCTSQYVQLPIGTTVTLSATPYVGPTYGYTFGGWTGDADCSDGIVTIQASAVSCTAVFTGFPYFYKSAPWSGQVFTSRDVTFKWNAVAGATEYLVCIDAIDNDECDTAWQSAGTATTLTVGNMNAGTYYWLAEAVMPTGAYVADFGEATSFSVRIPPPPYGNYRGLPWSDFVVFRPSTGEWWVRSQDTSVRVLGRSGDIPVTGDFDGDGRADMAVFRPGTGEWLIDALPTVSFGVSGDIPVPADYDGDGKTDVAVYRPSTGEWLVQGQPTVQIGGLAGDLPVPCDYDGDAKAERTIFRPSTGEWWIDGQPAPIVWGGQGDVPVPADYDGNGRDELAVYRPSTGEWRVQGQWSVQVGQPGDLPVTLDTNGDRRTDYVVFRPSTGQWFVQFANYPAITCETKWGAPGDFPVGRNATWMFMPADGGARAPDASPDSPPMNGSANPPATTTTPTLLAGDKPQRAMPRAGGDSDRIGKRLQPSMARWQLPNGRQVELGQPGDAPAPGDYDGDGIPDIAVYRPGDRTWRVITSSSGFMRRVVIRGDAERDKR